MKKYLFVITTWSGGGIERVFKNVVDSICSTEKDSIVYLFVVKKYNKKYYFPNNIVLIKSFYELFLLKIKKHFDIIINFSGDWMSSLVSRFVNKKYVSWIHCNPYSMKQAKTSNMNFCLLKNSYQCVCVCYEQKEILVNEFGFNRSRISVLYNSINTYDIEKKILEPCPLDKEPFILMIARIDMKTKDFYTLVDAYSLLDKDLKRIYKLVFVGDGPDRQKLERYIANKKLVKNVILWGYDNNPYRWLNNASCFVMSSRSEGMNVSVIEAMKIGCPIVLTDCHTGAKELSQNGKNTKIVKVADVNGMALAITEILLNKEVSIKLIENSKVFSKKFCMSNFRLGLNEIFK